MLCNYYSELEKRIDEVIKLCKSPIEKELLHKIIDYALTNSIIYKSSDYDCNCYNLSFISEMNCIGVKVININSSYVKLKDQSKGELDLVFRGIRINYSGYNEKEFSRYIEIIPQKKFFYQVEDERYGISTIDRTFFLDFGVFLKDYKTDKLIKKFCIECDGFEYHSKMEQIIRDNERELKLTKEGNYHTLRYLGKQIKNMKLEEIETLMNILFNEKEDVNYK